MADEHEIHREQQNTMGFIMGIILLVVIIFLFLYYLLPTTRGTQVSIPSRIDINLRQVK